MNACSAWLRNRLDTIQKNRQAGLTLALTLLIASSVFASETEGQPRWNPSVPSIGAKNLIPNSSFELGTDHWSSLGTPTVGGGDLCGLVGTIEAGNAYDGEHCLRIDLGPGKTPVTHSDYTLGTSTTTIQAAPRAATLGWMDVSPGTTYTLSAWMRADRDGVPADLLFRFGGEINSRFGTNTHTERVTLTTEWARYSFSMEAEHPDVYVAVGPNLRDTPDASATVWIDAVQLEVTPGSPAVGGEAAPPVMTPYAPRETVEIGINTEHYGNLFDCKDATGFTVVGLNTTAHPARIELRVELEDYFGERGAMTAHGLDLPASQRATTFLPLTVPGTGYYRAHLSWSANDVLHTRTIKFAIIDTYPWEDSIFGLNHAPTTREACAQLRKGGTLWARDWSAKWESVEATEGTYDYAELDRQVDRIAANGMLPQFLLPPQPSAAWASEAPEEDLRPVERTAYAPKPAHREQLNQFIAATVTRYQDRVTYWEFLNEPLWVPWYCLPTNGGYTVDTYIDLLKGASAAMKAADPDCKVLGGLSIMAQSKLGDEFIEKGGLAYVDIYNLHPYPEGTGPESFIPSMERIQATMAAHGGPKPIWATELSYWATDDKPWSPWTPPNTSHWSANRQQASEREAADFNIRQSVILLAHGVEKIFWHSGLEGEVNVGSMDLENPLLDPEAVPQKFFAAQAALANLLGPAPIFVAPLQKPDAVENHKTDKVHGYAFEGPKGAVLIVWSPGVLNTGKPGAGGVIHLGESPVYFTSTTMTAKALAGAGTLAYSNAFNGWTVTMPEAVDAFTLVGAPMGR